MPETDKYGLFYAVERFVFGLAIQAPILLVVEDLHWSDDASLDFLLHLAQRLAGRRLLLLLTYRSEEAGGGPGPLRPRAQPGAAGRRAAAGPVYTRRGGCHAVRLCPHNTIANRRRARSSA
jgi:hypothetical protein